MARKSLTTGAGLARKEDLKKIVPVATDRVGAFLARNMYALHQLHSPNKNTRSFLAILKREAKSSTVDTNFEEQGFRIVSRALSEPPDKNAQEAIRLFAVARVLSTFPNTISGYVAEELLGVSRTSKNYQKYRNERDKIIVGAVALAVECGLSVTRNRKHSGISACSLVSSLSNVGEKSVEGAWYKRKRRKERHNTRPKN